MILLLIFILGSTIIQAQSFDCKDARTGVELSISLKVPHLFRRKYSTFISQV
jgi:hypothetical protein